MNKVLPSAFEGRWEKKVWVSCILSALLFSLDRKGDCQALCWLLDSCGQIWTRRVLQRGHCWWGEALVPFSSHLPRLWQGLVLSAPLVSWFTFCGFGEPSQPSPIVQCVAELPPEKRKREWDYTFWWHWCVGLAQPSCLKILTDCVEMLSLQESDADATLCNMLSRNFSVILAFVHSDSSNIFDLFPLSNCKLFLPWFAKGLEEETRRKCVPMQCCKRSATAQWWRAFAGCKIQCAWLLSPFSLRSPIQRSIYMKCQSPCETIWELIICGEWFGPINYGSHIRKRIGLMYHMIFLASELGTHWYQISMMVLLNTDWWPLTKIIGEICSILSYYSLLRP